jgi:exosome complex RNA-binding protein Rrp4
VNQFVVGVIRNKMGEGFIVDINAPQDALLGGL